MSTPMDGWRRLAQFVIERRLDLNLTQEDVRARGGPSTASMRLIEGALQESYSEMTLAKLEQVLGWQRGSAKAVLAGGEPTLREQHETVSKGGPELEDASGSGPFHHSELGEITHPQDREVWALKSLDEQWKVAAIKNLRKDRLWAETPPELRSA